MTQSPPIVSYLYVVVRRDLAQPHRSVQAIHAAVAADHAHPFADEVAHPILVLCEVADEAALRDEFERMKAKHVPCAAFHEEDMGGQMTAIATGAISGVERRKLRHLRLLKD